MCRSAVWSLECEPASVGRARRLIEQSLAAWGVTETDVLAGRVADVVLAASEMVANALRYSSCPISLEVEAHRDRVRVAVSDDHPGPAVARRAGPLEESGQGLTLVEALSDDWGQEQSDETAKTVWFSVEVPAGSALGVDCQR